MENNHHTPIPDSNSNGTDSRILQDLINRQNQQQIQQANQQIAQQQIQENLIRQQQINNAHQQGQNLFNSFQGGLSDERVQYNRPHGDTTYVGDAINFINKDYDIQVAQQKAVDTTHMTDVTFNGISQQDIQKNYSNTLFADVMTDAVNTSHNPISVGTDGLSSTASDIHGGISNKDMNLIVNDVNNFNNGASGLASAIPDMLGHTVNGENDLSNLKSLYGADQSGYANISKESQAFLDAHMNEITASGGRVDVNGIDVGSDFSKYVQGGVLTLGADEIAGLQAHQSFVNGQNEFVHTMQSQINAFQAALQDDDPEKALRHMHREDLNGAITALSALSIREQQGNDIDSFYTDAHKSELNARFDSRADALESEANAAYDKADYFQDLDDYYGGGTSYGDTAEDYRDDADEKLNKKKDIEKDKADFIKAETKAEKDETFKKNTLEQGHQAGDDGHEGRVSRRSRSIQHALTTTAYHDPNRRNDDTTGALMAGGMREVNQLRRMRRGFTADWQEASAKAAHWKTHGIRGAGKEKDFSEKIASDLDKRRDAFSDVRKARWGKSQSAREKAEKELNKARDALADTKRARRRYRRDKKYNDKLAKGEKLSAKEIKRHDKLMEKDLRQGKKIALRRQRRDEKIGHRLRDRARDARDHIRNVIDKINPITRIKTKFGKTKAGQWWNDKGRDIMSRIAHPIQFLKSQIQQWLINIFKNAILPAIISILPYLLLVLCVFIGLITVCAVMFGTRSTDSDGNDNGVQTDNVAQYQEIIDGLTQAQYDMTSNANLQAQKALESHHNDADVKAQIDTEVAKKGGHTYKDFAVDVKLGETRDCIDEYGNISNNMNTYIQDFYMAKYRINDGLDDSNVKNVTQYCIHLWTGRDNFDSDDAKGGTSSNETGKEDGDVTIGDKTYHVTGLGDGAILYSYKAGNEYFYKGVAGGSTGAIMAAVTGPAGIIYTAAVDHVRKEFSYAAWEGNHWTGENHRVQYHQHFNSDGTPETTLKFNSDGKVNWLLGNDSECAFKTEYHQNIDECPTPAYHGTKHTFDNNTDYDMNWDGIGDTYLPGMTDKGLYVITDAAGLSDCDKYHTVRGSLKPGTPELHEHTDDCYPLVEDTATVPHITGYENGSPVYDGTNVTIVTGHHRDYSNPICGKQEYGHRDYPGGPLCYSASDYDTWYVCEGHCPTHITPLVDYAYVANTHNLAAYDDRAADDLKSWRDQWGDLWKKAKAAILAKAIGADSDALESMLGITTSSWNHWDKKDIDFLDGWIGTYDDKYAKGKKMMEDMGLSLPSDFETLSQATGEDTPENPYTQGNDIGIIPGEDDGNVKIRGYLPTDTYATVRVPYINQGDYANVPMTSNHPDKTIKSSGCGFCSMAMAISGLKGTLVSPATLVHKYGSMYYAYNQGIAHAGIPAMARDYGLSCTYTTKSNTNAIINHVANGGLAIIWVHDYPFTSKGHTMMIRGVTADHSQFYIASSSSAAKYNHGKDVNTQTWPISTVINAMTQDVYLLK